MSYMISKIRLFEILSGSVRDRASRTCEILVISVVIANIFAVMLDSVPDIHEKYKDFFALFELISVIFFTIESYGESVFYNHHGG